MIIKERILKLADTFIRLPLAGVDISDESLKYVSIHPDGVVSFPQWGEVSIPEGMIVDGEIRKEAECALFFRGFLEGEGKFLRSSFIVASLPEEKSFFRLIQIPKIRREEVQNVIRWEIEKNIPLAPEEILYDYEVIEPLENSLDHIDIALTAFPRAVVESYVRVLSQAGMHLAALELESQAIARAVVPTLRGPEAFAIVDLGKIRTGFVVWSGNGIHFTTTIKVGGKLFEDALRRALGVDAAESQRLKKDVGLNRVTEGGRVFETLVPAISTIADELRRAIEYYQSHVTHLHGARATIQKILLAGGDANLYGLETYLSSVLKIPVSLADPLIFLRPRLRCQIPPFDKNVVLAFATAVGLALRGMR